jgi:hypothetical protein
VTSKAVIQLIYDMNSRWNLDWLTEERFEKRFVEQKREFEEKFAEQSKEIERLKSLVELLIQEIRTTMRDTETMQRERDVAKEEIAELKESLKMDYYAQWQAAKELADTYQKRSEKNRKELEQAQRAVRGHENKWTRINSSNWRGD